MPPITTTISALSVNAAPMVGLTPTKEDSRMPATAASAPPVAKAKRAVADHVDADQRRGVRAGGNGAHGAAGRGVAQERKHGGRQHQRGDQHDQAVGADDACRTSSAGTER